MQSDAPLCDVLYEDNHVVAVNKPALLPTMGVGPEEPSLLESVRSYIRREYAKPGNVYLGVVSRLDAPVTGVVLLARTSKAAGRLSASFRQRQVKKTYLAIVEGCIEPDHGVLEHYLRKDERHRKVHVTHAGAADAQMARLEYRWLQTTGALSLIEVDLQTGRKHQIRVQLAKSGCPILGDLKYGSRRPFRPGIALHARALEVEHPVRHEPLRIEAPLPAAWLRNGEIAALIRGIS
ncbi:MAG TPA: RluA family pseudouridine synthase [Lacipirellulaceae bacterium]|nr:RluA family pseudouridine synthase [Lacipirellulaceae bacterium]